MLYCACRLIALCIQKFHAICAYFCRLIALCILKIHAICACVCRLIAFCILKIHAICACVCRLIALCILKIYATCACVCRLIALCIQKIYAMYACVCSLRIGAAAPSRTPCPNRISAFEKAVRCCGENPAENVITPVLGTSFDSLGETYDLCVHVGGYHPESTVKLFMLHAHR
uniref:Uncharacterized protein n=1 Tax=Aegilops tauschii subsp. strangulata TaxID=200361 RepID=A0A453RA24_AEGTS